VHRFLERGNLLAELSPGGEHGLNDRCNIGPGGDQGLNAAVERQAANRPRQHPEGLEHTPGCGSTIGLSSDKLSARVEQGASPVGVEGLHMNRHYRQISQPPRLADVHMCTNPDLYAIQYDRNMQDLPVEAINDWVAKERAYRFDAEN
jgi:hypothetical protein